MARPRSAHTFLHTQLVHKLCLLTAWLPLEKTLDFSRLRGLLLASKLTQICNHDLALAPSFSNSLKLQATFAFGEVDSNQDFLVLADLTLEG